MSDGIPLTSLAGMARTMARDDALRIAKAWPGLAGLGRPLAHWEQAELFRHMLPLALHDALYGTGFAAFRDTWRTEFGPAITPYLLSLYLAAVSSPSFDREARPTATEDALFVAKSCEQQETPDAD